MPGDCLVKHEKDMIASTGTYIKNGYIFACIAGYGHIEQQTQKVDIGDDEAQSTSIVKRIVSIKRPDKARPVPSIEPGQIVTCRVLRVTSSFVKVAIHCVEDVVLRTPYTGIIRQDDIRDFDRDKVTTYKSFHPGDILLARVYAPSENHLFLLTTTSDELGVVIATNDWGEPLVPISDQEMVCKRTFTRHARKVAKIDSIA